MTFNSCGWYNILSVVNMLKSYSYNTVVVYAKTNCNTQTLHSHKYGIISACMHTKFKQKVWTSFMNTSGIYDQMEWNGINFAPTKIYPKKKMISLFRWCCWILVNQSKNRVK